MKGWGLPIAGDPLNHSALLSAAQIDILRAQCGIGDDDWAAFDAGSDEGRLCLSRSARLVDHQLAQLPVTVDDLPSDLATRIGPETSSQEAFGNALVELARSGGRLAERLVTTSPDVTVSTNLGGWVNRVGVFATRVHADDPDAASRLLKWLPSPSGQHVELGISEMNLFLLLGQMGLSHELNGQLLLPIGTVYDPFVCRGLDALLYGTYSGSKFVFAGTPAGVTLSPEGGAHQSAVTVSIGLETPNLRFYEPCFAREVQWCLLEGIRQCLDRSTGVSTYLRLSTRPVDQAPFEAAKARLGEVELRRQVIRGGYRLLEPDLVALSGAPSVVLAVSGPLVPEALAAAHELTDEGVAVSVLNLTGLDALYASFRNSRLGAVRAGMIPGPVGHFDVLLPPTERRAPIVTLLDAASHSAAFLGSVFGQPVVPLGVDSYGQSGARADVYAYAGVDADHIVSAALAALHLV
jgi:pyruvate dehydrogenase E1 component